MRDQKVVMDQLAHERELSKELKANVKQLDEQYCEFQASQKQVEKVNRQLRQELRLTKDDLVCDS